MLDYVWLLRGDLAKFFRTSFLVAWRLMGVAGSLIVFDLIFCVASFYVQLMFEML